MINYISKTTPTALQSKYSSQIKNANYLGLFATMGAGKTKMMIDAVGHKFINNLINLVIIIAPKTCLNGWIDEIELHLSEQINWAAFAYDSSIANRKSTVSCFNEFLNCSQSVLKFFIINPDSVATKNGQLFIKEFIKLKEYGLCTIIDESTCIKNLTANRTKVIKKTLKSVSEYRYILSGTPAPNSPTDYYSQCDFLSSRILEAPTIALFRSRYCKMKEIRVNGRSFMIEHSYFNLDDLRSRLEKHCIFITPEELADSLPDQKYLSVNFKLTDEQSKIYKQMRDLFITKIGEEIVSVDSIAAKLSKLQQITSGFIYAKSEITGENVPTNVVSLDENPRLNALINTCYEIQGKSIIFTRFTASYNNVVARMEQEFGKESLACITPGMTIDKFEDIKNRFIDDEKCKFLISNVSTISRGINKLTVANYCIYYENDYNLETRLQSEKRTHRRGQKNTCFYVDLICQGTMDEQIAKALISKKNILETVMSPDKFNELLSKTNV